MKTALKLLVMAFIAAAASRMIFVVRLDPSGTAVILPRNIPLPDAPLTPWDAKGKTASAANLPERPALLVFFGTWCPPCLAEYETLLKISKRPDSPPLIGIAVRDDPEKIAALFKTRGRAFSETYTDSETAWSKALNASALPAVFLTDGKGKAAYRIRGVLTERFFEDKIRPLIKGMTADVSK